MGCKPSKLNKKINDPYDIEKINEESENLNDISDAALVQQKDANIISEIKNDLNKTPEIFVLNNVLMCTMFLKNYEDEAINAATELAKSASPTFWEPHIIMDKVNKNVIYRPIHGPKKGSAEPLITRRIYVPLTNFVQVFNPMDDENYSEHSVQTSSSKYQVKTEECNRRGFVKLRRLNDDENHNENSVKDAALLIVPSSSTHSGSSDNGSSTTSTNTGDLFPKSGIPQFIKDQQDEATLDDCFVYRKIKKAEADMLLDEINAQMLTEDDVYDIVSYLASKKFMKFFQSTVFKKSVAEQLGLVQYEVDNAEIGVPGKILCNLRNDIGSCYPVEIIPCLKTSWPSKETHQFAEDQLTNQILLETTSRKSSIQWPTKRMLNKVKVFDCALVPKGYSNKKFRSQKDLSWEIHFPLAEKYFESLLNPEQIKCYLVLVSIFKEYLQPYSRSFGVVPEHFINLIFWESEKDYESWPQYRLGLKLISLIKHFSENLSIRQQKDYFIRQKNIFKDLPRNCLDYANETFHRIKQSPLMYIIRALRNIRYISKNFYPPINYKELLEILYKKDWDDENPYLSNLSINNGDDDAISISIYSIGNNNNERKFDDAEKQLHYNKVKEKRKKEMDKSKDLKNTANLTYTGIDSRRDSIDSINDNWEVEKQFSHPKKIALLNFFIKNFIDISKACIKNGTQKQALFYLKQAGYLAKILEEENQLFAEELDGTIKEINKLEQKVINDMQINLAAHGRIDNVENKFNLTEQEEDEEKLDDFEDNNNKSSSANHHAQHEVITDLNNMNNNNNLHQRVRQNTINLNTLSKSFSKNYFKT